MTQSTRRVGVLQALFSIQLFGVLVVGIVLLLLLAWLFLRERLTPPQWAGIGIIIGGVLLVSV